jgi:putative ABC transport system ATP-binding protein
MLELREVTKRYRSGSEVITAAERVTMRVDAGELVALYGPSGSGKTTLLLMAAGIVSPDSGAVLFNGVNLADQSESERVHHLRRSVGVVLQTMELQAGLSALDNAAVKLVAEGMNPRAARARTAPLLDVVGLGERAHHRPRELSTGEKQRVGIARALVNDPPLVLADEPTGNLDSRRSREVLALLAQACKVRRVGVLLVTHDPQAVGYADRVLTLHDGTVHEGLRDDGLGNVVGTRG